MFRTHGKSARTGLTEIQAKLGLQTADQNSLSTGKPGRDWYIEAKIECQVWKNRQDILLFSPLRLEPELHSP